jgi:hypothetical protein
MTLNTVQEIERAIDALTPDQREELHVWLDEHYLQSGDMQLKAAIDAGRFDDRIARPPADHKAGRTEPLQRRSARCTAPTRNFRKSIGLGPPLPANGRTSNLLCLETIVAF